MRQSQGFVRAKLSDAHGLSNTVGFAPGMDGTKMGRCRLTLSNSR